VRLLIVTWLYEPHSTPRAIRWKTIARELVAMGCQVDVVTSRATGEPTFEELGGVRVHRCGGSAGMQLAVFAKGARAGRPLNRLLQRLHKATWKKLYWPDKACLWMFPAIRTARRLLNLNRYDGLITVSLPFTAHVVGHRLKRLHPNLAWLVDVGDPFSCQDASAPNNVKLHGRRNLIWERKVFQRADRVAVTNEAMSRVYGELFPASATKLEVIPPVVGADVPKHCPPPTRHAKKRLLFLGTLYKNIRNPGYLLTAFDMLRQAPPESYELHLAGDLNDCAELVATFQARLGDSLIVHNNQSRQEAMSMLAEADFVVNIGNTTPFQLPSKLVEYVSMGKHIINLANCDEDSSTLFLQPYGAALNIRQTAQPTSLDVARLRTFLESASELLPARIETWLQQFSARSVAASYLAALKLTPNLRRAA